MRKSDHGPTGIMTRDEIHRSLNGETTREQSAEFWTADRIWQTATDVLSCGVASAEVATAGLGPEAAPVVLDGILTLGACVPSLIGDFTLDSRQNTVTHKAALLATPIGLASGLLGALVGGSDLDSMAAAASAGTLLRDTAGQALNPSPGLLGGFEFASYLDEAAHAASDLAYYQDPTRQDSPPPTRLGTSVSGPGGPGDADGPLRVNPGDSDFHFEGNDPHEDDLDHGREVVV